MKFEEIKNPYTLQFSYIPPQFIERSIITNEIINKSLGWFRRHTLEVLSIFNVTDSEKHCLFNIILHTGHYQEVQLMNIYNPK